jgi:hypothetical protein
MLEMLREPVDLLIRFFEAILVIGNVDKPGLLGFLYEWSS